MEALREGLEFQMFASAPVRSSEAEEAFRRDLLQFRAKWAETPKTARAAELAALAAEVLADDGLAKFSMRQVAERAGMTLAALQYHFKSLDALLKAMIDYRIDTYVDQAITYLEGLSNDPLSAFRTHIAAFIDDAMSAPTARFTAQYQALACIDQYAAAALDQYMRLYRESLGLFIRRINPALDLDDSVCRGAVLAGMIDGLMVIASEGKPQHAQLRGIKAAVEQCALVVAFAPPRV